MLKDIDLSKEMAKEEYKKLKENFELRIAELQRKIVEKKIPVIIIFEGWDAAGKGTLINKMILPMEPKYFNVYTMHEPTEEEKRHPFLWRFWINTPQRGRIAVFDRSWYRKTFEDRVNKVIKEDEVEKYYDEINSFERQLFDDGFVIIKFFIHISEKEQRKRLRKLRKDEATSWRVTEKDWRHNFEYKEYRKVMSKTIEATNTEIVPWTIIEGNDKYYAAAKMFETLINVLEKKIKEDNLAKEPQIDINKQLKEKIDDNILDQVAITVKDKETIKREESILDKIDLSKKLETVEYKETLKKYQKRLRELHYILYKKRIPLVIVYEGWDAAGKGGNIKRVTKLLDPRGYDVISIAAPTPLELNHHYLWRFWNRMPKSGHISIFDRSWYGRVMVERIEGFCKEAEWKRAYREINEMEKNIVNFEGIVLKFWIHIDKDEQMKRFNDRMNNPHKKWKITDEDWRNRDKWDKYKTSVEDMIRETDTEYAPWIIVEGNDKHYARIKVLKKIVEEIEKKI